MYNLLSSKEKEKLTIVDIKKDQLLFHENEVCVSVALVISGQIIIRSIDLNGKEIIYNIINEGGIFANNLLFSNDKRYKGDVLATQKSKVALLSEDNLIEILMNNEIFLRTYLSVQAENIKQINFMVKLLSLDSARERFIYYLEYHHRHIKIESITRLSKELSLTRETLSRLISSLIKEKIIIKEKQLIKLIN